MNKYTQVTSAIIAKMKERGYSDQSINNHAKIYETLSRYLESVETAYSPDLGKAMLEEGSNECFGIKGDFVRAAALAKLNDVWLNGTLKNAAVSPRKPYSSIRLYAAFEIFVSGFQEYCRDILGFSESQIENAVRRCRLFLKCMQSWDRKSLTEITYVDIRNYHNELSHLKHISREANDVIRVFKNQKDIYAQAYKNCDIIGALRPHRNFWYNAYVQENFIEGFDIIYVAVTPDGYIAFPKEMPFIWQIMIEEKANEYANNHFVYMDSSYKNFPMISVTYKNVNFGAGAVQSHEIRQKICDILQSNGYYMLITSEDQLMCIPTEMKGIEKEKIKEFVIALANKVHTIITHDVYQYDMQSDHINKV